MEDAARAPSPCSSSSSLATADAVASSPKEFEESSSHGGSTHNPKKKVKFLCSFGGRILPRPADGKLRYVGGETRIVSVNRDASFSELMAKLAEVCNSSDDGFFLKYQLPEEEDLDSLVSVLCDDDVGNMMEEFDKLEAIDGFTRLRVFLFSVSSPSALECGSLDPDIDQRYVDALNGVSLSMSRSESYNSLSNYAENCLSGTGSGRIVAAAPHPMLLPNSPRHMLPVVQSPPMSPLGHVLHQVDDYQQQQQHQGEFYHEPYHQDHQFYAQELQQQIYQQKQQQQIYHPSQESQQQQMYHHHEQQQQQQQQQCWTVGSHLNMHDLSASIGSSVSACRGQQAELLPSEDHSRMAFSHKQYLKAFPSSETYAGNSPEYNSPRDLPKRLDSHWPEEKPRAVPDIVSCQPPYTHHSTQQHYSMPVNYHVTDVPRSVEYGSPRFAQRPNHIGHSFAPPRRAENFQHNDVQHYPKHNEVDGSWHMPYQNHCDNSQQSNAQYMLKHYEAETTWHGPTTLQNIVCDETSQEFSHSRALQTKSLLQPAIQSPRFQDGMCTNEYRKNPIDEDNCRTSGCQKNIQAVWSQSCDVLETMEPKHDYTSLHAELYSSQNSHQKCCHQPCVDRQIKIQGRPSIHGAEIGITNHTQGMVEGVSVFERQYDRQIIAAASSSSRLVEQVSSHQVKFWPKQPEDHIHHACCGIVKDSNHFEMQSRIPHEDHVVPFMHHNCTEIGYEDKLDRARAWVMHSRDVACDPSFEGTCSSRCTKDEMIKKVVSNGHSEHAYKYAHEGNPDASSQNAPFLSDKSNVNNRIELSVNLPNDLQIETYHCSTQAENSRTGVVEGKFANTNMGSPYTSHDVNATAGQSTHFEMPDSSPTRCESSVGIKGQEKVELSEAKTDISIPNGEQRHTEVNTNHGSHASSHLLAKNISKKMLPESLNLPSASQVMSSELSASNLVNKDAPSPGPPIYDKSPENSIDVAEPHDIILETGGEEEHHNSGKQGNKNDAIDHVSEDGSKKSSHKIPSEETLAEAEINCLDTNDLKEQRCKEAEVESSPARTNSLNIDDKGKKISETSNRDENCKNFEVQEDSKPSNRDDNCVSLKKEPEIPHEEKGSIEENRDPEVKQMEPVEALKLGRVNFANDKSIPEIQALAQGLQIIKNDDLEEIRELGSGTYGTVYYGRWKGSDVAIKRIKASCFTGDQAEKERLISDFWREACTLSKLHHPNVVAFYGIVLDGPDGTLATITEYMVNGSLKQVLNKKDRTIDRRKRLILARDAACGMQYLHEKNIVHFDLKCDNLLVNMRDPHRPICKIGDLGLSKIKQRTLVSSGVRGTLPWMAPELLSGKSGGMVTEKVDVYSFGIVMWELLTGEEPYPKMHCGEIIGGILDNTLRPPIPNWCDPGWRALMEKCWSHDPHERPSFPEIAAELRAMSDAGNVK